MHGCVNVSRKVFTHPVLQGEAFSRREAWIWLIATAVFRPYRLKWAQHNVVLQRGQLVASYPQMAREWGWHQSKVRRFLQRLEAEGMIETGIATDPGTGTPPRKITICNYDEYQLTPERADTPTDTPTDTHKNTGYKNNPTSARARARESGQGHRLPEGWQPKITHHHLAQKLSMTTERLNDEADRFRDYWHAESGQKARKRDWDRAFNTWLRRAGERGQRPAAGQQAQGHRRGPGSLTAATRDLLSGCGG